MFFTVRCRMLYPMTAGIATARPTAWRPATSQAGGAEFLRRSSPKEVLVMRVRQGEGAGSWRARVNLAEGVYRLEGAARVAGQ